MQAERRKKKLVYFLSRGAAYLGPKVKDCIREEKKETCLFFIPRRSLSWTEGQRYIREEKKETRLFFIPRFGPKVKDSVLFLTKYNNVVGFLSKFAADKKIIIKTIFHL